MTHESQIELIKKVRKQTRLSLTECKKILEEANWDLSKLDSLLEKYFIKLAAKKQERETKEGRFFVKSETNKIKFLFLACETDFVSSNEMFIELGNKLINTDSETERKSLINEGIAKLSENIQITDEGEFECNYYYLYRGKNLTALQSDSANDELNKQIALHILSMAVSFDFSTLEQLLDQNWFLDETIKVKDYLLKHNIILKDFLLK